MSRFRNIFQSAKPIIGVIHLPPLPGFDGHPGMEALLRHALADLEVLVACKVDGVLVENEHDKPHQVMASPDVIAAMRDITAAVVAASRNIVVGCEILLNDPRASLEVAAHTGASFIRSDYFVDRMSRPGYGEFAIDPVALVNYRNDLAPGVLILADVQVKYATMLEPRPLGESVRLAVHHGADAVVVTGDATGSAPRREHLQEATVAVSAGDEAIPVLIGSGLDPTNAVGLLQDCDGAIVGTSMMHNGKIDAQKTTALMSGVRLAAGV
jgi:membrane complex biogenesis BtpA family protein